jgi:sulfite exporter TauE/SafE
MEIIAFMLGLTGSLHCLGMCGPLAMVLPGGNARWPTLLGGRLLYNGGRIATYTVLGGLSGLFGHLLSMAFLQRGLSLIAGGMIIASLLWMFFHRTKENQPVVQWVQNKVAGLLHNRRTFTLLPIGLLNGLLPCGLVYLALTMSIVQGSATRAMLFMFYFGLGTLPMMLAASLGIQLLPSRQQQRWNRVLPFVMLASGVLLLLRGMSLGIPYISPDLEAGICCHGIIDH